MGNKEKWTEEQKTAIIEKGENILVAAAAGSGKTTVLVERIIKKIINEKIDIDKLLVVTFTNAAASEMRERILEAIYEKLDENPDDENLQKQIVLLGKSNICTIHSFCLDVIRNNFYEIDLPANFKIGSEEEIELLKLETLEDVFEELYENNDERFAKLIEAYTSYRGDEKLKNLVLKIYSFIQSSPFPEEWLSEKIEMFNIKDSDQDFSKSIWGKILLNEVKNEIYEAICNLKLALKQLEKYEELSKFTLTIQTDIDKLKEFYNLAEKSWDDAFEYANSFKFNMWPREKVESEVKEQAKATREAVKNKLKDLKTKILLYNSNEAFEDIYAMYDILKNIEYLILKFKQNFQKKKREKNLIDFNDIEHYALKILVKKDENGNPVPTDVAKSYREKFEEIAIDEYQDSNEVQEYILSTISRGNNVFMVGDIKQSIYKFRQARPELFLHKYESYSKTKEGKGIKIQLFKNFRSRDNVINFTNIIFKNIMSKELGDLDYTEEEYLNPGASFSETTYSNYEKAKTELLLVDLKEKEDSEEIKQIIEKEEIEAKLVAKKIKELINNKIIISDKKEGAREVTYKDIVILLRSTSNASPIYEKELIKNNIPVYSDTSSEYLDTYEIQTIINTLRILDNPIDDISLVSVLRSEIGGFTDNELIEIRLENRESSFYQSLIDSSVKLGGNLGEKVKSFLSRIENWREKSKYLSLAELIWTIYTETGFYNYVSLMPNGNLRKANLKKLFENAKKYENSSFKGLFNFIRFIEKVKSGSGDLSPAKIIGENDNVVRIMSIHKSKGLEFPIVFLSSTSKKINTQDLNDSILLHQLIGIGPEYINYERRIQYSTAAKRAIRLVSREETISEEMRILYVALTRAKEKLIITGTSKDVKKELEDKKDLIEIYNSVEKINPILLKKYISYKDWIELVYLEGKLGNEMTLEIIPKKDLLNDEDDDNLEVKVFPFKQDIVNEKIESIFTYRYPFEKIINLPLKSTVSKIKEMNNENNGVDFQTDLLNGQYMFGFSQIVEDKTDNNEFFIKNKIDLKNNRPNFLKDDINLTSTEKGTLVHYILQKLDFSLEYSKSDLEKIINNYVLKNIITETQAKSVDFNRILAFLNSNFYKDIKEAKKIYKEKTFCTKILAKSIFGNTDFSEKEADSYILVQGIIDLFYKNKNDEWILVDYKTDYVKPGEENQLVKKYKKQLDIYKKALEDELEEKVIHTYIYSIYLNKCIELI